MTSTRCMKPDEFENNTLNLSKRSLAAAGESQVGWNSAQCQSEILPGKIVEPNFS